MTAALNKMNKSGKKTRNESLEKTQATAKAKKNALSKKISYEQLEEIAENKSTGKQVTKKFTSTLNSTDQFVEFENAAAASVMAEATNT